MPMIVPEAGLRAVRAGLGKIAEPIGTAIRRAGHEQLRKEFRESHDPHGQAWQKRRDGGPALVSKKLPTAFTSTRDGATVRFVGRVHNREWLDAHDQGHTFGPRKVDGRSVILRYNAKGRLVRAKRFAKLKRGRAVFAKAHSIGKRVLPARPIIPRGALPAEWEKAIGLAVEAGLHKKLDPVAAGK